VSAQSMIHVKRNLIAGAAIVALAAASPACAATYKVVYSFQNGSDGAYPLAGLVNLGGTFYGTTSAGGAHAQGTVFSITPAGAETVLHAFGVAGDGAQPYARLVSVGGNLYGTTLEGGTDNHGTIFQVTPAGVVSLLHSFANANDGSYPQARLLDLGGTLYGTTANGGVGNDEGTVFKVTPAGAYAVAYSFGGYEFADGCAPVAGLINLNGKLFGTTESCGGTSTSKGIVFNLTSDGTETVLHNFDRTRDAAFPQSVLVKLGGWFYGTSRGGGASGPGATGFGAVFRVTAAGVEKLVHSFQGGNDGANPVAGMINVGGTLYGTTKAGGSATNCGTVFSMTPAGVETIVHAFAAPGTTQDGSAPQGALLDVGGVLYGTTANGGAHGYGTVFSITP
jgi:uncharacterized repeat protein (TIGR03803 family)